MRVHACTIVARNYLAAARVLADSFVQHHPDGSFAVLVVDDVNREVDAANESFSVMHTDEIGIDHDELLRMTAIYTVMEFCTAVKPWLLQTLLDNGAETVLYLDPDIKVFGSLEALSSQAAIHEVVLTPHVTEPLPRDGRSTSEDEILSSGIYNLGFAGVGKRSDSVLSYWKERLRRDCVADPKAMRFVDQRWMDFVPALFDTHIEKSVAYNVAYWNLSQRPFQTRNGEYIVGDVPLKFFHFSGYDPRVPHLLSKHQGQRPRVLLSQHPAIQDICDEYGADLLKGGYEEGIGTEYNFARLSNGSVFDPVMRKVYREALIDSEEQGAALPPNPYDASTVEAFFDWLNEIAPANKFLRLSRYLASSYSGRVDLQAVFADPDGVDFQKFAEWSRHEVTMHRLDHRLMITNKVMPQVASGELRSGIRVAGYLRAETGVGELGRLTVATAEAAGVDVATYVDVHSVSRQDHEFVAADRDDLNVNIVCVNADEFGNFARRVGPSFFENRYTIGIWAWEIEEFPDQFNSSFEFVDEVWAISEFSRKAIAEKTDKPVVNFPLPIVRPQFKPNMERSAFGLPDGFAFLFCFDLLSIIERKNPFGLIEAFENAFAPGEGPTLVIKAVNSERKVSDLERLKLVASKRSDIVIFDEYLDADENAALMNSCDCYVSLHRSEGFGLTMGEAMSLGKPVIATDYSGNLEFMTDATSFLVPFTYGEIPGGCEPYRKGARWAEPDLAKAAELMRQVYFNRDEAKLVGAQAELHVQQAHSVAARAEILLDRVNRAQSILAERKNSTASDATPSSGAPKVVRRVARGVASRTLRRPS